MTNTQEHFDRIDEFLFEIGPQTYVHLDRGRAAAVESLTALRKQIAEMKRKAMDQENEEAAVCPEDVGFGEYIGSLNRRIATLTAERDQLRYRLQTWTDAWAEGHLSAVQTRDERIRALEEALRYCECPMSRAALSPAAEPTLRTDAAAPPPEPRS